MPLSETILVIMGLLAVAMIAAGLCRNLPIPFTVFLVVLGMLLAWLAGRVPALAPLEEFQLTPELVFFVFLPALIFESALNLDARQLVKDLVPILALAIPALLLSTAIIGAGVWQILGVELATALLFGALIAATDPVAVIALFKELGAPLRLTTLVEGESLFNDATAIVLFHILLGLALHGAEAGNPLLEFLRVFFGGVLVGSVLGLGVSELMRRLHSSSMGMLVMSLVMAYSSFVLAEHVLHFSGVMAAVSSALAMGLYGVTRIPQDALRLIHESWEVIALVCNSLLFLMIGLTVDLGSLYALAPQILATAVLVLLARAAAVYTLVPATTRLFSLPTIHLGERHIMCWGGLKGGLAIAIVLSVPETLPGRDFLITLTLGVVLFTLLVNAPTIRPLIRALGIDRMNEEEQTQLGRGLSSARGEAGRVLEELREAGVTSRQALARIGDGIDATFRAEAEQLDSERGRRRAHLEALRVEQEALERLYAIDLIEEYTYLDLRTTLARDRERWLSSGGPEAAGAPVRRSPFRRLETAIIRRLREVNLTAGLLARYQRMRLSQRLQRDIAGIVISQSALAALDEDPEIPTGHREAVARTYRERLGRRRARVDAIRREFPGFYERFEERFFQRAALLNARSRIEREHHAGDLGAKAFARIERQIEWALQRLPALPPAVPEVRPHELIQRVPLFAGLSEPMLQALVERTQLVTFLPGDAVIGEGEHGNALYIILNGAVEVLKRREDGAAERVADLGPGEFFGETALLGDDVRTATVKARGPLTLLRLARREVLALAEEDAAFERHLHEVYAARLAGGGAAAPPASA